MILQIADINLTIPYDGLEKVDPRIGTIERLEDIAASNTHQTRGLSK